MATSERKPRLDDVHRPEGEYQVHDRLEGGRLVESQLVGRSVLAADPDLPAAVHGPGFEPGRRPLRARPASRHGRRSASGFPQSCRE